MGNAMPVDLVDPIDVSNAIAWLVSDDARYITGTVVPVDAGALNKR
jgi:NAD(P)-dependent dehydrogenase (short-subunit alcohol dehydrogenase family)